MLDARRRTRTTILGLGLVPAVLAVAACGGDDDSAEPPPSANVTAGIDTTQAVDSGAEPATSTNVTPGVDTTSAPEPDVGLDLDEKVPPPPGLEDQFDTYTGGSPWGCMPEALPAREPPFFASADVYVGETAHLCGAGFVAGEAVAVTVVNPQGDVFQLPVQESSPDSELPWSASFFPEPGAPTGVYRVEATQGDLRIEHTFVVELAPFPSLVVSTGQPIPDRTPALLDPAAEPRANVFLVGFPPNSVVRLFLFAVEEDTTRTFRRELPSVTIDERGEGTLGLDVSPDTHPGMYCVAYLEQLTHEGQLTNDPCYRPGATTQELIVGSVTVLRRGDSGPAVRLLQAALASPQYDVTVDGEFGPATEAAVRQFQSDHQLEADGLAGPETQRALGIIG